VNQSSCSTFCDFPKEAEEGEEEEEKKKTKKK
jgi:hypothetical protein